jgi:ABC-type multidrug transport system fused ATPase/permease subunit
MKGLLETVLFANIRFHDTVSRGRLLNRFGKDFEGIDSSLSDNLGRSIINGLSVTVTVITITLVGGPFFFLALCVLGVLYWNGELRDLYYFWLVGSLTDIYSCQGKFANSSPFPGFGFIPC